MRCSLITRLTFVFVFGVASANTYSQNTAIPAAIDQNSKIDAARLLTQATFGARYADVESTASFIERHGVAEWVDAQAALPATLHYPLTAALSEELVDLPGGAARPNRMEAWWRASLTGEDQLRQRVAFALSQLFVVSENSQLNGLQIELANYYDLLVLNAFGNYRDLMEVVTTSPVMGLYLSMLGNEKPQPELNIRPDENYARELMQLFSIGLNEMHLDGTVKEDQQGNAIPTYTQDDIEAYARTFTGWHFAGKNARTWEVRFFGRDFIAAMEAVEEFHDQDTKTLLNGVVIPAGTSPEVALDMALDSLFEHANVAPFVAKHMIQHLVTSNPSPAYIERVALAFEDNGEGIRGDMLAVVSAVLTDDEAREPDSYEQDSFGKVKQPLIRVTQIIKAVLPAQVSYPEDQPVFRELSNIQNSTAMAPLSAPSVFNFFLPDHQVAGELQELGMVAPEFQMITSNNVVRNSNFPATFLYAPVLQPLRVRLGVTLRDYEALNATPDVLLDQFDLLFLQGQMSDEYRDVLLNYNTALPRRTSSRLRVAEWMNLIFTSPQFAIQK